MKGKFHVAYLDQQLIQMQCRFGTWIRLTSQQQYNGSGTFFVLPHPLRKTEKQCPTLLAIIYGPRIHVAAFWKEAGGASFNPALYPIVLSV